MLVVDQLKGDRMIRVISIVVMFGMLMLVGKLWYLQIINGSKYLEQQQNQSYRTVRIPAARGEVLDCNGVVLAETHPTYNLVLYLRDLSKTGKFRDEYRRLKKHPETAEMSTAERSQVARCNVYCDVLTQLSQIIGVEVTPNLKKFNRHYAEERVLPFVLLSDISPEIMARFLESPQRPDGVGIETEIFRKYPHQELGSQFLGYLQKRVTKSDEVEFSYRKPDYQGATGLERAFDEQLRGECGGKLVMVDNVGYSQREEEWISSYSGQDIFLTIDARIQSVAEKALRSVSPTVQGSAVVLDALSGDILAMASMPSYNPNLFIPGINSESWAVYNDPKTMPTVCRATYAQYAPGSIFKIVVGLAALENGLDPTRQIHCQGYTMVGKRRINDTAPADDYDFTLAFMRSSNDYFIQVGRECGIDSILSMGEQFFLGKKTEIPTCQDVGGFLPTKAYVDEQKIQREWMDGHTANICIGQGDLTVTPLQMAVMTAAVANGGTVFYPRLVTRLETRDENNPLPGVNYQKGRVRGRLQVRPENLRIIQDAMLADVEDARGTGKAAWIKGFRVCGKTGTAEVKRGSILERKDTWFASFAPYEQPRYVVVVLVEKGASGGKTCAPVARQIYETLLQIEQGVWKGKI